MQLNKLITERHRTQMEVLSSALGTNTIKRLLTLFLLSLKTRDLQYIFYKDGFK